MDKAPARDAMEGKERPEGAQYYTFSVISRAPRGRNEEFSGM